MLHVLAVFPAWAEPRVAAVTFGIEYDECVGVLDWGPCADFELPGTNWPESGEGTAVVWNDPHTDRIFELYWFAAYVEVPEIGRFALAPHPVHGTRFADDSIPAIQDEVADLGTFGFYSPGEVPCQFGAGACCLELECIFVSPAACFRAGGIYRGDAVPCDPDPCGPVPIIETSWGQIKAAFRE